VIAHSALEAALRQDLRDEASWTVYADWLSSEGDSRGELIGYEQRADRETDPELAKQWRERAKQLFERDHQDWLGSLRQGMMPRWTRGFVTEAHVHDRPGWTLSTLLSMRTGALLHQLIFTFLQDCRPVADALRDSWIENIELRRLDRKPIEPFANVIGLRELYLYGCQIDDFAALAELPALERVIVYESMLDHRAFERGFAKLRHLVLTRYGLRHLGGLDALVQLPALEMLDLHGTDVEDLGPLERLTKLRQLDISTTRVRSLAPLERLVTLERVDARDMQHLPRTEVERLRARGVLVETRPQSSRREP
jgi:uncharacterized protein (TIGR02996 family)